MLTTVVECMTISEAFTLFAHICKSFRIHVVFNTKFPHAEFNKYKGRNRAQVVMLRSREPVHNFANLTKLYMIGPAANKITKCPKLTDLTVSNRDSIFSMDTMHNLRCLVDAPWTSARVGWRYLNLELLCNLEECDVRSLVIHASSAIGHKKLKTLTCDKLIFDLEAGTKSSTLSSLSCGSQSSFLTDEQVYRLWQSMANPIKFQYGKCRVGSLPADMMETPDLLVTVSNVFVEQPGTLVMNIDHELFLIKIPK